MGREGDRDGQIDGDSMGREGDRDRDGQIDRGSMGGGRETETVR